MTKTPTTDPAAGPHRYRAYGLEIDSDSQLALMPGGAGEPDALIRLRHDPPPETGEAAAGVLHFDRNRILLAYPMVGVVELTRGERIDIWPAPDLDRSLLGVFVIGNLMAMLLHQSGRLVVHASCAVIGGMAVAFAGVSGAGKTSLAAACQRAGLRVLSDDVAAIDLDAGRRVDAGYPFIKIDLETAARFGCDPAELGLLHNGEPNKRSWRLPGFASGSEVLGAVFLIEKGEDDAIERLPQGEALIQLLPHVFPTRLVLPGDAKQLAQLGRLVKETPVYRFRRRPGLEHLMAHVERIKVVLGRKIC